VVITGSSRGQLCLVCHDGRESDIGDGHRLGFRLSLSHSKWSCFQNYFVRGLVATPATIFGNRPLADDLCL
jgi:hypothetical protein